MAGKQILEIKVKQCIRNLDTLVEVIFRRSKENESKYLEVTGCIAEVLNRLSAASPDKETVEEACGKLKDVVQEYNDSGDNLDIKKAAGQLASKIAMTSSDEYTEFLAMLRAEDKDGLLKHFVEAPASIEILDVSFANTDADSNIVGDYGSTLYYDTEYLKPRIKYRVISTGPSIDIWYKIFSPNGELVGSDARPGFSWKGTIDRNERTVYNTALGGFGNPRKDCYKECGTWTIEFYEGSRMIYSTTFEINHRVTSEEVLEMIEKYSKPTPPPQPTPTPKPTPRPTYKRSLWQRFKDKIESIGEWFAEEDSDAAIAVIFYVLALIIYVGAIVITWIEDGFWSALIPGIVGFFILGIAYYAIAIVSIILKWILRVIFLNVWTFFISLILLFGWFVYIPLMVFISNHGIDAIEESITEEVEVVVPTTTYYCTSKKGLKVREFPSTSAPQLGSLTYGEATEVYEIDGSFAKIKYDKAESGEAWVSSKYISQTPPYSN